MSVADIRYSEKSAVGVLELESIIWLWDDRVDLFQIIDVNGSISREGIGLDKNTAVKFAKMIIQKYGVAE